MAWAQRRFVGEIERQYNGGLPVRIIVLKARQLGISTATEGVLFTWSFLHPGANGLVISHENGPSQELFQMTKFYWESWAYNRVYNLQYSTKQQLRWIETRSQLRVATAKNVQSGRGSTLHAVHASEVAFYPDPETLMLGLNQTIPHRHGTIVVLESTANGVGNYFYDQWQEAEEGGSDYVPMFFPWWKHPEYRLTTTLNTRLELDDDEKILYSIITDDEELTRSEVFSAIAWRRWAIINKANGDIATFMQEYPSTPEEAFITTGRPIFSSTHIQQIYKREKGYRGRLIDTPTGRGVAFEPDPNGPLTIYRRPRLGDTRQDRFFVAGDPSETIVGDPACIQVINRQTNEQVAVWHGRINPIHFAYEMMRVGRYYNQATLCPEAEGGGQATISTLINLGYPNIWMHRNADRVPKGMNAFGWSTNYNRKRWCIGLLQRLIVDHSTIVHDPITYTQLRNYVERDDGTWGNNDQVSHDDSVMALAIGVTASASEGPFMADARPSAVMDMYQSQNFDDYHDPNSMYDEMLQGA